MVEELSSQLVTSLLISSPVFKNIDDFKKNKELVESTFNMCIKGYHMVNSTPISETTWEDLNSQIFNALDIKVLSKSDGSHSPGMDIDSSFGKLSNKSSKYPANKSYIDISSYRLTTVCNAKECGKIEDIIAEINSRKNFDYYSFIVRNELADSDMIEYDWIMIPSNHDILNPEKYEWEKMVGLRGKNKGEQVGWKTKDIDGSNMSITFSMSSQLWMHIKMTDAIKKFIIASTKTRKTHVFDYIQLFKKVNDITKLEEKIKMLEKK